MNRLLFPCLFGFVCLVFGQDNIPADCGKCDRSACPSQDGKNCVAGVIRDRCQCCQVCAQVEGGICDLPGSEYKNPPCGDYLQCEPLQQDNKIGVCVCNYQKKICGTDDVTYSNICKMREAQAKKGGADEVKVKSTGPCKTPPVILSGPDSVTNVTGDDIVLICEASGYPIPHIGWLFQKSDGETSSLPGDDKSVSTVSRGGPEEYQITGWLQVEGARKSHEGYYICVAHNKLGVDKKTGRIKIHHKKDQNSSKPVKDQL